MLPSRFNITVPWREKAKGAQHKTAIDRQQQGTVLNAALHTNGGICKTTRNAAVEYVNWDQIVQTEETQDCMMPEKGSGGMGPRLVWRKESARCTCTSKDKIPLNTDLKNCQNHMMHYINFRCKTPLPRALRARARARARVPADQGFTAGKKKRKKCR